MQLRFLLISGPKDASAVIDFGPGLNVIYGGSNTGKSHILRLIDFVLGARAPPEPIVEQAEFDLAHLGVVLDDGSEKTFVRALQGGHIRVLDGHFRGRPEQSQGALASAQHSAANSLSRMLLGQLGVSNARIRTDATGKTRDLSFRDLARLSLVNETKIQDTLSPVLSGQYITKTAETSVFKLMLTGVDDAAVDLAKPDPAQPARQAAQLELLDGQIRDLDRQIVEADQDHEELLRLETELDDRLSRTFELQEATEVGYRELTRDRRALRQEYDAIQDRISEIETLEARFALLTEHYESDGRRLASIIEAGSYFTLEAGETCPVCGADAQHHRPDSACDGNVDEIVEAASAEAEELKSRSIELQVTVRGLESERSALSIRAGELLSRIESIQRDILREVPSVQVVRRETTQVIQQKLGIQRNLDLIRRREALLAQRAELGVSPGYDSSTILARQQLDGVVLDSFCKEIEGELRQWEFPGSDRVFFELQRMDISVAGKSRAANGKGVRALLHGAFDLALMTYCRKKKTPHAGFLVLDSLFITYRDPSDLEEAAIARTPLKDRAFRTFSDLPDDLQLIILENVDVPDWLVGQPQCTHFTGEPIVGRAGLFPALATH